MEFLALVLIGGVLVWSFQKKRAAEAQLEEEYQAADPATALARAKQALDNYLAQQRAGISQAQFETPGFSSPTSLRSGFFEVPDVSGGTIDRGLPRIMKIAPKAHWWTSRFQTGTAASVVFQNDGDLVSVGLFPKGSIVAYLGITSQSGCDVQSGECQFQRSYVTGARVDGTMLLGWVESSDLVDL